jgi:hypothetical protein
MPSTVRFLNAQNICRNQKTPNQSHSNDLDNLEGEWLPLIVTSSKQFCILTFLQSLNPSFSKKGSKSAAMCQCRNFYFWICDHCAAMMDNCRNPEVSLPFDAFPQVNRRIHENMRGSNPILKVKLWPWDAEQGFSSVLSQPGPSHSHPPMPPSSKATLRPPYSSPPNSSPRLLSRTRNPQGGGGYEKGS